jgi:type IX secretion system PorP/SprF family membrane protein
MKHNMKKISFLMAALLMSLGFVNAQDVNFSRVEDASIFYNPGLNLKTTSTVNALHRNVSFDNSTAIQTTASWANLVAASKKNADAIEDKGYFNFTFGAGSDNAGGMLKTSNAVLGVAYSMPLNKSGLRMALGFQSQLYNASLNFAGQTFPKQFDQFGFLPNVAPGDRIYNYGENQWVSVNAGASISKSSEKNAWYLGASMRHLNQPSINWQSLSTYVLSSSLGIQAGYTHMGATTQTSGYVFITQKANAYEYVIGTRVQQKIGSADKQIKIGAGLGYRVDDALLASVDFMWGRAAFGINYDFSQGDMKTLGVAKNAVEVGLRYKLKK